MFSTGMRARAASSVSFNPSKKTEWCRLGGASPAHTHPKSAFIYATVLEGAVRSSVNGSPEQVYKVGEHFIEEPGSFHAVSANASDTEPSRLMAVFVLDSNEKELVTPAKK